MEHHLPKEMIDEIINNLNPDELVNFCETGYNKCEDKFIKNKILSFIDTTYDLTNFTVNQLLLFYKINKTKNTLYVKSDVIYTIENNEIGLYYIGNNHQQSLDTGNINMYQIIVANIIYGIDIYGNFFSIDGYNNISTALLTNILKIVKIDYDNYPYHIFDSPFVKIKYGYNINVIDIDGNCYAIDPKFNERKIEVKNVIQKKGILVLNKFGDVYVELNNGYIYNPITEKRINLNKYFHLSPFSNYKYKKLNINNIKQVTIYGDMLDNEGNIFRFDWNTMGVNNLMFNNIVQIENLYKDILYLFVLLDNGEIYVETQKLTTGNDVATEFHLSGHYLIYLKSNYDIVSVDLSLFLLFELAF